MSRYHRRRRGRGRFTHAERLAIFNRAGWRCERCGRQGWPLEADHVTPLAAGGTSSLDNAQALCPGCHRDKTRVENGATPRDPRWDQLVESRRPRRRQR